jgi:hypothetical protein
VLVDGGVAAEPPPNIDLDAILAAVIGPAIERLSMQFATIDEYHDFWRAHPALNADWSDAVRATIDYDADGTPPAVHSRVSLDAVRRDAADTLTADTRLAIEHTHCPIDLLLAERGMLDQDLPVFIDALVDPVVERIGSRCAVRRVTGVNHYTVLLSERGAKEVATAVRG